MRQTETITIPLLRDHHNHPSIYIALMECEDLSDNSRYPLEVIKSKEKACQDEVLVFDGWIGNTYFNPNANDDEKNERKNFLKELDNLETPIVICHVSLHGFVMNKSAKDKYRTTYTDIVKNIENRDWVEDNLYKIFAFIISIRRDYCDKEHIIEYLNSELLNEHGIWCADDMLSTDIEIAREFKKIPNFNKRIKFWVEDVTYRKIENNEEAKKLIYGIKVFTDGGIGAGTAAIDGQDGKGEKNLLHERNQDLKDIFIQVNTYGKSIALHALGDLAVEQILDVIDDMKKEELSQIPQIRIEHCQFISREQGLRIKELNREKEIEIVLSMQPNFSSDSETLGHKMPQGYPERNNPFRMLIDELGYVPGKDLIFGSDGMPNGVEEALEQSLFSKIENQKLTIEEFKAGYCTKEMEDDKDIGHIEVEIDYENKKVTKKQTVLHTKMFTPSTKFRVIPSHRRFSGLKDHYLG